MFKFPREQLKNGLYQQQATIIEFVVRVIYVEGISEQESKGFDLSDT